MGVVTVLGTSSARWILWYRALAGLYGGGVCGECGVFTCRNSIDVSNRSARIGPNAIAWHYDSNQVQRVGGGDGDNLTCVGLFARYSERLYRARQRELFAQEATYEAASAYLALIFKPTKCY